MALQGVKVVEMVGLAPGPLCGTILADFGASVTAIQRIQPSIYDVMLNGKRNISIDLKTKEGMLIAKRLCAASDVLLDTFRPGVLEKIGLGPEILIKDNPRLIYARLTGYGQSGYFKNKAGHDINYISMSGVLSLLGKHKQPPQPPINLLADFAGGSVLTALGILLALYERESSGKGQVIDASMTEGAAYVATWLLKSRNLPFCSGEPGTNLLDGGIPFYGIYETKDGLYMAVGALEPMFYSNFLKGLQLSEDEYKQGNDIEKCKNAFKETFLTKTQAEWCEVFENLDACVTPVLNLDNVDQHKCNSSRNSFYRNDEQLILPNPSPKLSRTPGRSVGQMPATEHGQHTIQILTELGYTSDNIEDFIRNKIVYVSHTNSKL